MPLQEPPFIKDARGLSAEAHACRYRNLPACHPGFARGGKAPRAKPRGIAAIVAYVAENVTIPRTSRGHSRHPKVNANSRKNRLVLALAGELVSFETWVDGKKRRQFLERRLSSSSSWQKNILDRSRRNGRVKTEQANPSSFFGSLHAHNAPAGSRPAGAGHPTLWRLAPRFHARSSALQVYATRTSQLLGASRFRSPAQQTTCAPIASMQHPVVRCVALKRSKKSLAQPSTMPQAASLLAVAAVHAVSRLASSPPADHSFLYSDRQPL